MKRSNRLNPDKRMEVGESLVVERLRLGGRSGNLFVDSANAGSQWHRAVQNFAWNRTGWSVRSVIGSLSADNEVDPSEKEDCGVGAYELAAQDWNPSLVRLR